MLRVKLGCCCQSRRYLETSGGFQTKFNVKSGAFVPFPVLIRPTRWQLAVLSGTDIRKTTCYWYEYKVPGTATSLNVEPATSKVRYSYRKIV
jgi:hypothetical protein